MEHESVSIISDFMLGFSEDHAATDIVDNLGIQLFQPSLCEDQSRLKITSNINANTK
jgi:hypothetical protein